MNKSLITLFLMALYFTSYSFGQASTKIHKITLKIRDKDFGKINDAIVTVYDKQSMTVVNTQSTSAEGDVHFELPTFHDYIFSVAKKEYLTKNVWISSQPLGNESKTLLYYENELIVKIYNSFTDDIGGELIDLPSIKLSYFPIVKGSGGEGDEFKIDKLYEKDLKSKIGKLSPEEKKEAFNSVIQGHPAYLNGNKVIANPSPQKTKYISGIISTVVNDQVQPLSNTKIQLVGENGKSLEDIVTNSFGIFLFTKTPSGQDCYISLADKNPKLANTKVIITDLNGDQVNSTNSNAEGKFKFEFLKQDELKIKMMEVEDTQLIIKDPWLKYADKSGSEIKPTTIPEKVYFDFEDYKITKQAQVILAKVVQVMKVNQHIKIEIDSFTDSQGTAEFNKDLSDKRAKSAVDYVVSHGIAKERLSGVGYGETNPVSKCKICSEQENAQNRRIEFKISTLK